MTTLVCIVLALEGGYFIGRYRPFSYQDRGEALLARVVRKQFAPPNHHLMNHLTLRSWAYQKYPQARWLNIREDDALDEVRIAAWIQQATRLKGWASFAS